jgi:hypothetical protein
MFYIGLQRINPLKVALPSLFVVKAQQHLHFVVCQYLIASEPLVKAVETFFKRACLPLGF